LTLAQRILAILQRDAYARIPDFAWLLSVLVDLAYVARAPIGAQLRDALVDVCLRVRAVRPYASQLMVRVLADASSFVDDDGDGCGEVLWAAAWIVGEYRVEQKDAHRVIGYLIQPSIKFLPADTIAVFLQSAMKVFGYWMYITCLGIDCLPSHVWFRRGVAFSRIVRAVSPSRSTEANIRISRET
ncbi:hypothetical protein EXIGLDRAFT_764834, partial [Exidia glandulosa HHB12029]